MGVVYLAYCGSWQLSLHESCFYIFNTTPNPTSSSFFQNVFVLVVIRTNAFVILTNAFVSVINYCICHFKKINVCQYDKWWFVIFDWLL